MKSRIPYFASALILIGSAHAAVLVDNFESYDPLYEDMNSLGGWTVTNGDPALPEDGPVVIVDAYTWDMSNRSATVGGVEPSLAALTSLSHSVGVPLQSDTALQTSASFEFAYTESTEGGRNDYQIVVGTTDGNLLTIDLTPAGAGVYNVAWSSDFFTGDSGTVSANTSTSFAISTWLEGATMKYSLTNAGAPVSSGVLTGLATASTQINNFSVSWDSTSDIDGFGNGSLTIDNVAIVPEASSVLLLGLSSLALLRRRRH